jgi:pyrophosphatase PpaX
MTIGTVVPILPSPERVRSVSRRQAPEAILFDVDGTLIDTYHLYLESYRRALEPFLGYRPGDEEFIARRPSSEKRFLTDWIGEENAAACHSSMCEHYEVLHASLFGGIYDGVREMLAGLRSAGYPLGVVTGKGIAAWRITERVAHLGEFAVVVTDDDVEHPKPHPGGLLGAAAAIGVAPASVAYIGDSPGDLEAGRLAGMSVGAALWPKTAPGEKTWFLEEVSVHEPDWTFDRPADVVRAFAAWCG